MDPEWLRWARELQAIAQIGLTYSGENHFDVERYTRIREIAAEIMATGRQCDAAPTPRSGLRRRRCARRGVPTRREPPGRGAVDGGWALPG